MSSLIERFLALKSNYRNYDTKHALKRMQVFRCAVRNITSRGYPMALELLGSIAFGMTEAHSDADCVLLYFCDIHGDEGDCPDDCPNLQFEKDELDSALKTYMYEGEAFQIELLDWVNLKYIDNVLTKGDLKDDEVVFRLLYYSTMGRPVNRPLIVRYCDVLERDDELMSGFKEWGSEALVAYLQTVAHRYSFGKYNERLINRGVDLPAEIRDELSDYINPGNVQD